MAAIFSVAERFRAPLFRRRRALRRFVSSDKHVSYLASLNSTPVPELQRIVETQNLSVPAQDQMVVRVATNPFPFRIVLSELTSSDDHSLDLELEASCRIASPEQQRNFLRQYGLSALGASFTITSSMLEAELAREIRHLIADEIRSETYAYLRDPDNLPPRWWLAQLRQWNPWPWLEFTAVTTVRISSPDGERALEEERQRRLAEQEKKRREQAAQHELERQRMQAAFEEEEKRILHDRTLSELERRHELELLRRRHQLQLIQLEEEAELQRLEAEKRRAELEADIARIRHQGEEAQAIFAKAKTVAEDMREMLEGLATARQEFASAIQVLQAVASQGVSARPEMADHAAALSFQTLALAHEDDPLRLLLALARQAARKGGVAISMSRLRSRDIGTARMDALAIGAPLTFEITSQRTGYISVLNVGTSGKVYLLAPNALVAPAIARIAAGQPLTFPGPPLLPGMPLYENGPPGWEEVLVVVSDEPLFHDIDLRTATPEAPEVALPLARIATLVEQLREAPADAWSAALLGFMVE